MNKQILFFVSCDYSFLVLNMFWENSSRAAPHIAFNAMSLDIMIEY
jgi:hypothetical protein